MTECPDRECRDALKAGLDSKLSIRYFFTIIIILIGIASSVGGLWLRAHSGGEKEQTETMKENTATAADIKTDVTIIKTKQEHLHDRMKKLGVKMDGIGDTQQKVLRELIKINTTMEKNGNIN